MGGAWLGLLEVLWLQSFAIADNFVGLCLCAASGSEGGKKAQGLKPIDSMRLIGTTEAVPFHRTSCPCDFVLC
jgi:hypothetical protein